MLETGNRIIGKVNGPTSEEAGPWVRLGRLRSRSTTAPPRPDECFVHSRFRTRTLGVAPVEWFAGSGTTIRAGYRGIRLSLHYIRPLAFARDLYRFCPAFGAGASHLVVSLSDGCLGEPFLEVVTKCDESRTDPEKQAPEEDKAYNRNETFANLWAPPGGESNQNREDTPEEAIHDPHDALLLVWPGSHLGHVNSSTKSA